MVEKKIINKRKSIVRQRQLGESRVNTTGAGPLRVGGGQEKSETRRPRG